MIGRLLRAWRERTDARILERRAIPDPLWALTVARYPFISRRGEADIVRLRELSTLFLADKEFSGAGGLEVTDEMAVAVAAQACLPILNLGLDHYSSFVGIVMHRSEVVVRRESMDDDGIVHEEEQLLSGEVMEGGPMMLTWDDVEDAGTSAEWAYNVVIHEFAHVLDLRDGAADGVPALPTAAARRAWSELMAQEYETFCERVDDGVDTLLDPYGAEAIDEFFAVAAEAFFVAAEPMQQEHPALYGLFADYFKQDPASR
jgi:Mlc titration factor MtfA (ptsG expression regulator)